MGAARFGEERWDDSNHQTPATARTTANARAARSRIMAVQNVSRLMGGTKLRLGIRRLKYSMPEGQNPTHLLASGRLRNKDSV